MTKRKPSLPLASTRQGLGLPNIMDRDLAAAHGVRYVRLAAFAIDVDRVYWLEPEHSGLPFGWEVFLTEWYLLGRFDPNDDSVRDLLEALCTPLLEETPGEPPLGGQIAFAVYDAVQRGKLPAELAQLFRVWKAPPEELRASLAALHAQGLLNAVKLAEHCLNAELDPPLSPPTREALLQIQTGELLPPSAAGRAPLTER